MVAAMALAPAPSPIAVLGTAWMESGGSLSDRPSLQVSIPPYCFNRPGGGQVAQCPDPARDVGCEEDQVPCPRELCCAVPEKGQRSAYQAKELGSYRSLLCPGLSQISCVTLSRQLTGHSEKSCLSFRGGREHQMAHSRFPSVVFAVSPEGQAFPV